MKIYPDANIFLALWKGDSIGVKPFDLFAIEFFEDVLGRGDTLVVSDVTQYEVTKDFSKEMPTSGLRKKWLANIVDKFKRENLYEYATRTPQDDREALRLMGNYRSIGAHRADMFHLAIARRVGAVIVTQDRILLEACENEGVDARGVF